MKFKKLYILGAFVCASSQLLAQELNTAYFTEGYLMGHTLNPAMGNEDEYISIPVLGNLNVEMQGNLGLQDVLFDNPLYPNKSSKKKTTFMNPYISNEEALKGINKGDNRIINSINLGILSAGFKAFGGYNTIELNVKSNIGVSLPYELFEFAKSVGNNNYNIGNIYASGQAYAEIALGHSRQLNDKLRIGAKAKALIGIARADVAMEDMKANLTGNEWTVSGNATADVSMKNFQYKSETKEFKSKPGTYKYVNDVDVEDPGVGGFGLALDLGAIYKATDDIKVSAAIRDLGFISWSNDMQARNISGSASFDGFHDVSVNEDRNGNTIDSQADSYGDQLSQFANLQDLGDKGSRSTGLGATVNAGVEYTLPSYNKLSFGLLGTSRLDSHFGWSEARLSANYAPLSWLSGSVSVAAGTLASSAGFVLNIHPKGFNFFIGMDHIAGKTSKENIPLSSNTSLNVGMNITF